MQNHCQFILIFPIIFVWIDHRDAAMASITERAQRMEKDLRETTAKHDRTAAELQVRWRYPPTGVLLI